MEAGIFGQTSSKVSPPSLVKVLKQQFEQNRRYVIPLQTSPHIVAVSPMVIVCSAVLCVGVLPLPVSILFTSTFPPSPPSSWRPQDVLKVYLNTLPVALLGGATCVAMLRAGPSGLLLLTPASFTELTSIVRSTCAALFDLLHEIASANYAGGTEGCPTEAPPSAEELGR